MVNCFYLKTVFGTLVFLSGLLVACFPETTDVKFLDSIEKAEEFYKERSVVFKLLQRKYVPEVI